MMDQAAEILLLASPDAISSASCANSVCKAFETRQPTTNLLKTSTMNATYTKPVQVLTYVQIRNPQLVRIRCGEVTSDLIRWPRVGRILIPFMVGSRAVVRRELAVAGRSGHSCVARANDQHDLPQ